MRIERAENASISTPEQGQFFHIPTEHFDQHRPAIEFVLKQAEQWTQVISSDELCELLKNGKMHAWGVLHASGQLSLAITRLAEGVRGLLCTMWLFVPMTAQNDAAIGELLRNVERFARTQGASALEIVTAPWMRQSSHLAAVKHTAATFELDLRQSRSVN